MAVWFWLLDSALSCSLLLDSNLNSNTTMNHADTLEAVRTASLAHTAAAEALMLATQKAFPIGTIVRVTLGRNRIEGEVIGHSESWWYHPDYVRIRNTSSGKIRKFSATSLFDDAEVITLP